MLAVRALFPTGVRAVFTPFGSEERETEEATIHFCKVSHENQKSQVRILYGREAVSSGVERWLANQNHLTINVEREKRRLSTVNVKMGKLTESLGTATATRERSRRPHTGHNRVVLWHEAASWMATL